MIKNSSFLAKVTDFILLETNMESLQFNIIPCTHTHTHARARARAHTHTHIHIRTHTHTHTLNRKFDTISFLYFFKTFLVSPILGQYCLKKNTLLSCVYVFVGNRDQNVLLSVGACHFCVYRSLLFVVVGCCFFEGVRREK